MNLSNKAFELVENSSGHASARTVMKFSDSAEPFIGTYTGLTQFLVKLSSELQKLETLKCYINLSQQITNS